MGEMVLQYGNTAARVRQNILPDMCLAVEENCPELASAFLEQIHDWVLEMKEAGKKIEEQYQALSREIHALVDSTNILKQGLDREIVRGNVVNATGSTAAAAAASSAVPNTYHQLYSRLEKLVLEVGSSTDNTTNNALASGSGSSGSFAEDAATTNAQVMEMLFFTPQLQLTSPSTTTTNEGDGKQDGKYRRFRLSHLLPRQFWNG